MRRRGPHRAIAGLAAAMALALAGMGLAAASQAGEPSSIAQGLSAPACLIQITMDRYGDLFPSGDAALAAALDAHAPAPPPGEAQRVGDFGEPGQGDSPSHPSMRRASAHATSGRVSFAEVRTGRSQRSSTS